MNTEHPVETEQPDESRRDFIEKAGKAAVVAPAAAILLAGGLHSAPAYPYGGSGPAPGPGPAP